jgi:very-short-patch-repair endonuclease
MRGEASPESPMPKTRKSPHPARRKHNVHAARAMRLKPTTAEDILWQRLRNRQIMGKKFRRQHSIDRFIVDFFCAEANLVIEVDGPIHNQPNADAERTAALAACGLRVLRVTNAAITADLSAVIAQIRHALTNTDSP